MIVKTKTLDKKRNDLETNHSFGVPENIQKDINDRGFHLYKWIGEKDVKNSIERDFLKIIEKLGLPLAFILIIPSLVLSYIASLGVFYGYFWGVLAIINIVGLIYLLSISIKRSNALRKNAYVLLTDSHISINGEIIKLDENNKSLSKINKGVENISVLFEEELFKESQIGKSKKNISKKVLTKLKDGFVNIMRMGKGGSRNTGQIIFFLIVLYSIYSFTMLIIYFVGIFLISIFSFFLSIINKKILLVIGHEITTINDRFEEINYNSKKLLIEKDKLSGFLKEAMKNEWKDSLLTKINTGISNINNNAKTAVDTSITLKKEIQSSKYKEMFNFTTYNSWIKREIQTPLLEIRDLLELNLEKLNQNKIDIEEKIKNTSDDSLAGPLVASKTRTIMRIEEIEKHIKAINIYIDKLK